PLRGHGPLGGPPPGPPPLAALLLAEDDALGSGDVVGGHVDAEVLLDVRLHLARGGVPPHRLEGPPDRLLFGDLFCHVGLPLRVRNGRYFLSSLPRLIRLSPQGRLSAARPRPLGAVYPLPTEQADRVKWGPRGWPGWGEGEGSPPAASYLPPVGTAV